MILETREPPTAYLQSSEWIDHDHGEIREFIRAALPPSGTEEGRVRAAFEFVRDEVAHSWDIQSRRVTRKASDALRHREGICYAKSHLLAALLRGMGVPSGVCYQRLTLGETPETGHCIHALNTVYLASQGRWIRLDARGNKPGVNAQFSITEERLAFPIRPHFGESEDARNYAEPHPSIIQALTTHTDCRVMYAQGLPTELR